MSDAPQVVAKECRFAIHMPSRRSDIPDFHLVKEILHMSDGTLKPNVHFLKDYKRSFYITKKQYRNHKQKKEYESVDRLTRYECTQSELSYAIEKALGRDEILRAAQEVGKKWLTGVRQLSASPYLYGSDITSTSLIKYDYKTQWPDAVSNYRVAYFDIETDVVHGTDDPIMATIIFEGKIYCGVLKSFLVGYANPEYQALQTVRKYLAEFIEKHNFEIEIQLCDTTVDLIRGCIERAHRWSPDFLAIWNIDFDIPRILDTLKKYNVDPKDIFCDPKIPPELRFCKYKKGSTKKVTASGAVKPKNPSEQWHTLHCPAGFYVIDAMCTYRYVRQGAQELPYYSLDYVLNEELKFGKLKFDLTEGIVEEGTLEWHQYMQERHPLEYIAYNFFDCIGMLELETKTNDLSQAMPIQCGFTDFSKYISQTKKFANKFYLHILPEGKIVGTVPPIEEKEEGLASDEVPSEDDEEEVSNPEDELTDRRDVLSLRNWIVTLPSHLSTLGKPLLLEHPTIKTMIRAYVYDSDAVSAYPSCTAVANVSRETTVKEIIDIVGVDETVFRRQNINLLQGHVNALEYACVMHGLPRPQEALVLFDDL